MRKLTVVALVILSATCRASNLTLQGSFTADDNVQLFSVSVAAPATVDIRSYGYAGETTSTGTTVPAGGFDTILTLFDASGVFIDDNDDGASVPADPTTGLIGDARLTETLAPGNYIAALTQYDNFSLNNLADGFGETGNPNFTADPNFTTGGACRGNMFRDISGTAGRCRTGNWAVDFVNVASVTPLAPVPEPSALLLAGVGLALLLAIRRRDFRRKTSVLALGLLATLASVPLRAQTTNGPPPDFSNVGDFLNGQRTLLKVQDLELVESGQGSLGLLMYSITTSNSQQTISSSGTYANVYAAGTQPITVSAHMFNQASAVTISTMNNFQQAGCPQNCYGTANFALQFWNVGGGIGAGQWQPLQNGDNPTVTDGAVGDFNLDGYDDVVFSFANNNAGRLCLLSAQDLNPANFSKGPKTSIAAGDPLSAIAVGDFNGDGLQEIAGLFITPGGGMTLELFTVNTNNLTITLSGTPFTLVPDNPSSPVNAYSMARGRFNGNGHDQLVVAFATGGASSVEVIDFQVNSLTPVAAPPGSPASSVPFNSGGYLQVKTGKFGLPNNSFDQVVYHSSNGNSGGRFFEVLTVDQVQLTLTGTAPVTYDQVPCAAGIQVGNFDHRQADPTNPSQTEPNLNSQIAFMYCSPPPSGWAGYGYTMNIYSVNPSTFNINNASGPDSAAPLPVAFNTANNLPISFVATDIQGRSLILGEPTKITVKSASQPTAIVAVPPMHVDWVTDDTGAPPALLDLSYIWDGYNTTYQQEFTTGQASNTNNTTSWSFGAQESTTETVTIGDPDEGDGLKESDTAKAAQDLKGSSTAARGTYTADKFDYTVSTGIDDVVTYVDSDFYIWVYPVIGKTVCPSSTPTCSTGVPLTIQYSASNGNATVIRAPGNTLSWYQPPWEPGNILSYPATLPANSAQAGLGQLGVALPNLSQLGHGDPFYTDTSTSTETSTWENNSTASLSTGLNQNYSFDNNFSVSGQVGLEGVSVGAGFDIDVNGSFGFDSLTEHTSTIGASTGIIINKPGTFRNPNAYLYAVTPYIFGQQAPNGVVDTQQPPIAGDIQTSGFQSVLYTVSPDVTQGWWQTTYSQAPDIALNHPARWSEGHSYLPDGPPQAPPPACLDPGSGSELDCPILSTPTPNNPSGDFFHHMRGLFISNAKTPGQGPQLESVTMGDQLSLQARVYNYSLVPMGANTAWAAFYAAPWDADNAPDQAVLIDKVEVSLIPPFDPTVNNTNNTLNWLLTPAVTFDPSDPKYQAILTSTSSVMFYVAVWMQDAAGNLMTAEMPAHGFTTALATPSTEVPSLAAWIANEQNFSNNVGLFYQEISVLKPSTPPALGAVLPSALGAVRHPRPPEAALEIGKIDLSAKRVNVSDHVLLSATLQPSGETSGVTVNFYDGKPDDGGKIFRVTRIPYLASDASRTIRTVYRAETCGTHHLFAVVNQGKSFEVVRRAPPLQVNCSPKMAPRQGHASFGRH